MPKIYVDKDVYTAAKERISFIFDEFENIYVSFSGGKDSGVTLNMCIDEARKRGRKFGVLFMDLEAWYQKTIEFIERMFENNKDVLVPYWVCLPGESPNSLSYLEPTWIWWDKRKEPIWVRPMPKSPYVINEENNPFDFYKRNMPFEEFIKYFGDWYGKGEKTACLLGIRSAESLNRYRAVAMDKELYKGQIYSTKESEHTWNFYPLYDWTVEDIWTYNGKFHKDYNRLYDLFYKAGVSIHKMRVDEPYGNEEKAGLSMFKIIEPEIWAKVVNRVSGANFGNIYDGKRIMNAHYKLPKNHTWKSFTKFLLATLPPETAANYKTKFIKFIKYWNKVGCPMQEDFIKELETNYSDSIINTHEFSKRGKGDKEVIKFKKIVDEVPGVDNRDDILTWRRMAMAIIKNDYICKSLSFSITKDLTVRQHNLMEKYKNIIHGKEV
jgi:predicted phosphoadenosine phosphosulfate sulfurtransferase